MVRLLGFQSAAGSIQDVSQVVMSVGIIMSQGDSLPQAGDCLLEQTYFPQRGSHCVQRQRVAGALNQGLPALGDGRFCIAKAQQCSRQVVVGLGERNPQRERMPVRCKSAVVFVQIHQ